nr:beta-lactamase [uncultured bacterium]
MDTDRIITRLTALTRAHLVPGAQLAVHHAGRTWTYEVGLPADAAVPIGSVTKTFTATVAMALVSDGDLDLDAPLSDHLPGVADELTLRHLLSHTGGLPSDPEDPDDVRATSLRRHVRQAVRELHPLHRPGAGFSYSNLGYTLIGHLIEVATGMSWWEAVDAVLLRPLGLRARFTTGPADVTTGPADIVTGHAVNPATGRVVPVRQSLAQVDAPAGALAASATDLVTFGRMLGGAAPHLIDPDGLALMRAPVRHAEPFGMADGWGLGLALFHRDGVGWVGHDGTADGTSCHLRINPADGTAVALTANAGSGFAMWRDLVPDLVDAGLPVADYDGMRGLHHRIPPPPDCTGRFRNGEVEYAVRAVDRERLALTVDGEPFADLSLFDGLVFAMRDSDTGDTNQTGRFLRDPGDGGIHWIQIGGRLARRQVTTMS